MNVSKGIMDEKQRRDPYYDYYNASRPLNIVAHMRLGDLDSGRHVTTSQGLRKIPTDEYIKLLSHFRKAFSKARICVRSSTVNMTRATMMLHLQFTRAGIIFLTDNSVRSWWYRTLNRF